MVQNTAYFADFIRKARATAGLTQDQVHERGATYRQLQGRIEGGDAIELEAAALAAYDTAYGWPSDFAAAVARVGAYSTGIDTLAPNLIDGQLDPADAATVSGSTGSLLSALYDPGRRISVTALGFDPGTGRAIYSGWGILTNFAFRALRAVLDVRPGATLLDTQLLDATQVRSIVGNHDAPRPRNFYRLGSDDNPLAEYGHLITPLALDPLKDLTTLRDARALAQALLDQSGRVETTVDRAAFTYLAIAGFRSDSLSTITHIQETGGVILHHGDPKSAAFGEFWAAFRERHQASADLASPDLAALQLLNGVFRARELAKAIDIGTPSSEGDRLGRNTLPKIVRPLLLLTADAESDTVIFYDNDVVPQAPIVFAVAGGPTATRTFFRVRTVPGHLGRLTDPRLTYGSVGIAADADDLSVVARHQADHVDTLTNQVGRFGVFCVSGRASVVWIPEA